MKKRIISSLIIVFLIVAVDQLTKYLVRTHIQLFEVIEVLPFLNLVSIRNEGAAFGMFRSLGNTFFIVISVAALIFIFWVIVSGKDDYRLYSLLAGGAAGNMIDRIMFGKVVDFIDLAVSGYHWPAFNVADSALTLGIGFLFVKMFLRK